MIHSPSITTLDLTPFVIRAWCQIFFYCNSKQLNICMFLYFYSHVSQKPKWCNSNKISLDAICCTASSVINICKQSKFRAGEKGDMPSANIYEHYRQSRLVNQTKCPVLQLSSSLCSSAPFT